MQIIYRGQGKFLIKDKPHSVAFGNDDNQKPDEAVTLAIQTKTQHSMTKHPALPGGGTLLTLPGEYEVEGINCEGIQVSRQEQGESCELHTLFVVKFRDIHICYVGDFLPEVKEEHWNQLDECDILLFPVSKATLPNVSTAIKNTEPRVIIPYAVHDADDDIDAFCKDRGISRASVEKDQLNISKSDLSPDEETITILSCTTTS